MRNTRVKSVLWPFRLALAGILFLALIAGSFAWKAADAFLSKITSEPEMLLFKFSLFFGLAILFSSAAICILLSLTLRGKNT